MSRPDVLLPEADRDMRDTRSPHGGGALSAAPVLEQPELADKQSTAPRPGSASPAPDRAAPRTTVKEPSPRFTVGLPPVVFLSPDSADAPAREPNQPPRETGLPIAPASALISDIPLRLTNQGEDRRDETEIGRREEAHPAAPGVASPPEQRTFDDTNTAPDTPEPATPRDAERSTVSQASPVAEAMRFGDSDDPAAVRTAVSPQAEVYAADHDTPAHEDAQSPHRDATHTLPADGSQLQADAGGHDGRIPLAEGLAANDDGRGKYQRELEKVYEAFACTPEEEDLHIADDYISAKFWQTPQERASAEIPDAMQNPALNKKDERFGGRTAIEHLEEITPKVIFERAMNGVLADDPLDGANASNDQVADRLTKVFALLPPTAPLPSKGDIAAFFGQRHPDDGKILALALASLPAEYFLLHAHRQERRTEERDLEQDAFARLEDGINANIAKVYNFFATDPIATVEIALVENFLRRFHHMPKSDQDLGLLEIMNNAAFLKTRALYVETKKWGTPRRTPLDYLQAQITNAIVIEKMQEELAIHPISSEEFLHVQVENLLRKVAKASPVWALIPAERELVAILGVSRDTVRDAIQKLSVEEGLLEKRPGDGTRIAEEDRPTPPRVYDLSTKTGQTTLILRGLVVGLKFHERLPKEDDLIAALGVSRNVVRNALRNLREDGLLYSQNGRAYFKREPEVEPPQAPEDRIIDIVMTRREGKNPGDTISSITVLAKETGISRNTIRAAVNTLVEDKVITVAPAKGILKRDPEAPLPEHPAGIIERSLRERIAQGRVGDQLPSITELREEFHASRKDVIAAMTILNNEKRVIRKPGKGTFITNPEAYPEELPLNEQVTQILSDEIDAGMYASRPLPSKRKLAERFDVSRAPIASALKKLNAAGKIILEKNKYWAK